MITLPNVESHMIANNLHPNHATHPGDLLKEEIEYRGLSQRALAKKMGVNYSVLNEILNCKRPLSAEYAMLLAEALQLDAEPLLNMQTRYDMVSVRQKPTFISRLRKLAEINRVAVIL